MLKILKNNLKKSWWAIVLIFVLLCTQAMADLNLPDFTSKIVNVGIQQKGVENSSPEVITKSTMDKILLLTKEDELILNNYQIFSRANVSDKEYNKYLKKYPNIKTNDYLVGVSYTGMMDNNTVENGLKIFKKDDNIIVESLIHPYFAEKMSEYYITQNQDMKFKIENFGFDFTTYKEICANNDEKI